MWIKRIATAVFLTVLAVVIIFAAALIWETHFKRSDIVAYVSPDKIYTLEVYEKGEPSWPFGPAHCVLLLKKNHHRICKAEADVYNDGGWARKEDFSVSWLDDRTQILVFSAEQRDWEHVLYYDGEMSSGMYLIEALSGEYVNEDGSDRIIINGDRAALFYGDRETEGTVWIQRGTNVMIDYKDDGSLTTAVYEYDESRNGLTTLEGTEFYYKDE